MTFSAPSTNALTHVCGSGPSLAQGGETILRYRLPSEVGLAPTPNRKRYRKQDPKPKRYVITPDQAKAMGYKL
jgi:hypothetical protein